MRRAIVLAVIATFFPAVAGGQTAEERWVAIASRIPDLSFPTDVKTLSFLGGPSMAVHKPDGAGPFPAIVVAHTCGGLGQHTVEFTKDALARGHVVFILDALTQRGHKDYCGGSPAARASVPRGIKDVYQALEYLGRFEFVDKERVSLVGFSWGAIVGLLASGKSVARAFSPSRRFAAVVSFYPACLISGADILRPDTDQPLLVLLGDEDSPPFNADCLPRLTALKERGAPVAWQLYAKATHCWDCVGASGTPNSDFAGNRRLLQYSSEVTTSSYQRTFEFLAEQLKPR